MRWMIRRRVGDDRGATAVIVALLVSLFLLGIGAIATDTGFWYAERAQLQNGADSGAEAVALTCAKGACNSAAANSEANSNANDNYATVDFVCGNAAGLTVCTGDQANGSKCPSPPESGRYVNVHTTTLMDSGSSVLPPLLGKALHNDGESMHTCAQATWGPPGGLGNTTAFTISYCEWQLDVNYQTSPPSYASYPPWPPSYLKVFAGTAPAATSEAVLRLHGGTGARSCDTNNDSAGWDAPGAFGWVGDGTTCSVAITNDTYPTNTGNNAINACVQTFQNAYSSHEPIYIPVYDGTTGTGNNTIYHLKGFAAFIITGWDLTSGQSGWTQAGGTVKEPSLIALSEGASVAQANYCHKPLVASNSDVCVYGFFTQDLIPPSALPEGSGGTDLGLTSVRLSG